MSSIHATLQTCQPRCSGRFGLTILLIFIYVPHLYAQSEVESSTPQPVGELRSAGFWGPPSVPGAEGQELLLRELDRAGRATLSRLVIDDGKVARTAVTSAPQLLENPIHAVLGDGGAGDVLYLSTGGGQLRALTWNGEEEWTEQLKSHVSSAVSAADLDGDGRAELVAATNKRLQIFSCGSDGVLVKQQDFQHQIGWHNHHPVICNLHGDGRLSLLAAGTNNAGNLVLRAYRPDGGAIWETPLNVTGQDLRGLILNAGRFLTEGRTGVAVSLTDARRVHEGTFMLDGRTGKVLWFKGLYRDGPIVMPYRPSGIPIAYDLDRDGVEELGMDMLSYMAFLRGADGGFKFLRHTSNIRADDALYAGRLYNTFCPIWKAAGDAKPHWFVTAGFGPFGLMNPDPRHGVWREDLGYDVPSNIALVDVDGDGELEAGYAAINDATYGPARWNGPSISPQRPTPRPLPPTSTATSAANTFAASTASASAIKAKERFGGDRPCIFHGQ